ncbi:hypothetical protein Bca52824_094962 [Brassica carinata]|uniref:Uncharacterized protein n=1 Tax=Brassica carinata TaxID=52824 RepID=A0A8X7NZR2_BRACI|nr:hypothetical protein Bca52824_094962 [Brassica carinata]
MSGNQGEGLKKSTEEEEGARKMSLGMEQKESLEKGGETSGRSMEEEERGREERHQEEYGRGRESEEDVFGYGTQGGVSRDVREEELYGEGGRRDERYVEEGGVLGAIGETIAEIAKTTKNIVIGDTPPERTHEHGTTGYMGQEHGPR